MDNIIVFVFLSVCEYYIYIIYKYSEIYCIYIYTQIYIQIYLEGFEGTIFMCVCVHKRVHSMKDILHFPIFFFPNNVKREKIKIGCSKLIKKYLVIVKNRISCKRSMSKELKEEEIG